MDAVGEKLGYERKINEKRSTVIKEKSLLRKIRKEMKKVSSEDKSRHSLNVKFEAVQSDEGWRGLEVRLKNYIKTEIDGLKTFWEAQFKALQAAVLKTGSRVSSPPPPPSPSTTLVPATQLSQPNSTLEHAVIQTTDVSSPEVVKSSIRLVKKFVRKRAHTIIETNSNYPGRLLISKNARESIDFVLSKFVSR